MHKSLNLNSLHDCGHVLYVGHDYPSEIAGARFDPAGSTQHDLGARRADRRDPKRIGNPVDRVRRHGNEDPRGHRRRGRWLRESSRRTGRRCRRQRASRAARTARAAPHRELRWRCPGNAGRGRRGARVQPSHRDRWEQVPVGNAGSRQRPSTAKRRTRTRRAPRGAGWIGCSRIPPPCGWGSHSRRWIRVPPAFR